MGGPDASCPQLLDLIHTKTEWMVRDGGGNSYGGAEEKQLELKLGPPGQEDSASILSLGLFTKLSKTTTNISSGAKRGFLDTLEPDSDGYQKQQQKTGYLQFQKKTDGIETEKQQLSHERKASDDTLANQNSNQSRTAAAPVVGWPPIRSFRKNLANSSSKISPKNAIPETPQKPEKSSSGMFVKINMDGIPIGRKIDLKAYDNYDNLSSAVDKLFKGLLAVQRESAAAVSVISAEESAVITGLLDGSGEYTLVYEDNEGDRLLVGDVPWGMFVSTAKRLRVLKTSELSAFIPVSK